MGEDHQVGVTAQLVGEIKTHLRGHARAEVVIFHNHPRNILNNVADNEPIASSADRGLLAKMAYLDPLNLLRAFLGHGTVRFFLGENGYVRAFTTPDVFDVFQRLRAS